VVAGVLGNSVVPRWLVARRSHVATAGCVLGVCGDGVPVAQQHKELPKELRPLLQECGAARRAESRGKRRHFRSGPVATGQVGIGGGQAGLKGRGRGLRGRHYEGGCVAPPGVGQIGDQVENGEGLKKQKKRRSRTGASKRKQLSGSEAKGGINVILKKNDNEQHH